MPRSPFTVRRIAVLLTAVAVAAGAAVATAFVAGAAPAGAALVTEGSSCTKFTTTSYDDLVPSSDDDVAHAQTAVVALINAERVQRGLHTLCLSPTIRDAAATHAQNWRGSDRACPAGYSWFTCGHWDTRTGFAWPEDRIQASGFGPCAKGCVGEDTYLGGTADATRGAGGASPADAVSWWMDHDGGTGHREAILRADFTSVGVGIATWTDASGKPVAGYVLDLAKR